MALRPLFYDIEIHLYDGIGLEQKLGQLFSPPWWPLGVQDFKAKLYFHKVQYGDRFRLGCFTVSAIEGNHPGGSILYRLDGEEKHWLTKDEYEMLSIRKGTLSEDEREIMQSHAAMTDKLTGDGYPKHLSGKEIPPEVRILTIIDIFDALTADDRPYKPGMSPERALSVLKDMAEKEGRLDKTLVDFFIKSRCWEQAGADD